MPLSSESGFGPAVALIPAAGSGERMGATLPKTLLPLGGTTVLGLTLKTVLALESIELVVVTVPASHIGLFEEYASDRVKVVSGGPTRKVSVALGLKTLERSGVVEPSTLVVIHDAARCLVSREVLERALGAASEAGAVTTAVPMVDSLIKGEGSEWEPVSREQLWSVQTPQIFRWDLIKRAHAESLVEATDDASLVRRFAPVEIVLGDALNFKLTTPDHYSLAKTLLGDTSLEPKSR